AAGAATLSAPAILRRAHAQGGEVNVWTYANFVPDSFREQFEAETGIKVNIRLVDDQGKQFNLLAAEAPNPTADVVTVAGHRFLQFIDSDLLAPLDTDRLTHWGNINPTFSESDWATINGNKWGAPILSGMEVLAYNTDVVSAEEARSWDVLFADKYAKQTAYIIQDMMSIIMLKLGYDGNMVAYLDDPAEAARIVEEAKQYLIDRKPLVRKYYDGGAEVQQMFINQDIVVGHAWNGPIATLINDGLPVDMTIPKEGSYGFVYLYLQRHEQRTERGQCLYLPGCDSRLFGDRRDDDARVRLHFDVQGRGQASHRDRTQVHVVHRRGTRRAQVLPGRSERNEVRPGRPGGRSHQGRLIAPPTAPLRPAVGAGLVASGQVTSAQ
ncbi:MAG: extracellular solute-binding protein, partial [Thiotrichales bacterium]|nr:extracellular solute-binding protein [Thiotrichales bacterium]